MSHFWMQFLSDVAVLGCRCQFEIVILPERLAICGSSSRRPLRAMLFLLPKKRFENFAMSFDLLLKEVADLLIN